jgi:hypothetical protein
MRSVRSFRLMLMALLAVSLLVTRIGGMHLHLCLDGGEAPVAMHAADGGIHHGDEQAVPSHNDRDVDLADASFGKIGSDDAGGALLWAYVAFVFIRTPRSSRRVPVHSVATPKNSQYFLVPPLRGPPL